MLLLLLRKNLQRLVEAEQPKCENLGVGGWGRGRRRRKENIIRRCTRDKSDGKIKHLGLKSSATMQNKGLMKLGKKSWEMISNAVVRKQRFPESV